MIIIVFICNTKNKNINNYNKMAIINYNRYIIIKEIVMSND